MPCEILLRNDTHSGGVVNYTHPNATIDRSGPYKKGDPVDMIDSPRVFRGFKEGLPYSCAVRVTDGNVADVQVLIASVFSGDGLTQSWRREIDFQTVNNNPSIDGWRIRTFASNPGTTNLAEITRNMVENYLTKWNAQVFSTTQNEVIFNIAIYEDGSQNPGAIQSMGFWNVPPISVFFTETDYNQGTGLHTVEINYSQSIYTPEQVARQIREREGTVLSNADGIATFSITRNDVFLWFRFECREILEEKIYRRQFHVPESTIDNIIATGTQYLIEHFDKLGQSRGVVEYRVLDVTLAQIQSFLINRLNEVL